MSDDCSGSDVNAGSNVTVCDVELICAVGIVALFYDALSGDHALLEFRNGLGSREHFAKVAVVGVCVCADAVNVTVVIVDDVNCV